MYKNKDKQREADRARQKRRRDKIKAKSVTEQGVTQGVTKDMIEGVTFRPAKVVAGFINNKILDIGIKPKRGKDIKCFEDLPPDVQTTIRRVSESNEEFKRRVGIAIHYQHIFPHRYYL